MTFPTSSTRPDRPTIPAPKGARPIVIGIFSGLLGIVAGVIVDRQILQPSHSHVPPPSARIPMPALQPVSKPAISAANVSIPALQPAQVAPKDLASRIQALATETDRDRRLFALRDLVNSIAIKDMPSALAQANTIKRPEIRLNFLKMLFARWGEAEPQTAVKYVQALTRLQEQKIAVQGVLDSWVRQDMAAATAWVQTLPLGNLRNQSWPAGISALARQDPASALALAESQNLRRTSEAAYISVFREWAVQDPAAAAHDQ